MNKNNTKPLVINMKDLFLKEFLKEKRERILIELENEIQINFYKFYMMNNYISKFLILLPFRKICQSVEFSLCGYIQDQGVEHIFYRVASN